MVDKAKLIAFLEQHDGLQTGWFGRELARQLKREETYWKRHLERWERFRIRFAKMFAHRYGESVLGIDIYSSIEAWEAWYCGWPHDDLARDWHHHLSKSDRLELMRESRSAGKRVRLVRYVANYLDGCPNK